MAMREMGSVVLVVHHANKKGGQLGSSAARTRASSGARKAKRNCSIVCLPSEGTPVL
jgi:hypothetical protein